MKEVNKKQKKFEKICDDIKEIKIQGAKNIAKKALEAYHLIPTKKSLKKLLSLRPTEPLMMNILKSAEKESYEQLKNHFDEAKKKLIYNIVILQML